MLNTTIPTLEIKTTGTDLSTVETMHITIKQGSFQTVKSNDDIEVDNDVISLSLTQNEVSQLAEMAGISISILATRHDGETFNVKIVWAKRGSRTSHTSTGGGGGGEPAASNEVWYPTVSADGIISWAKSTSETPPAPRNIKGANGVTPHVDAATGNWFIGTVNTGVKARGTDGVTPSIGANGNWFISSNDTGVKARGTDGKDGANGTDGEDGFTPEITENSGNNDSTYKLDIATKSGSFTTPNLKGKDGIGGGASGDYLPLSGGTLTGEKQFGSILKITRSYPNSDIQMDLVPTNCPTFIRLQANSRQNNATFELYDIEEGKKATNLLSFSREGRRNVYVGEIQSMKKIVTEYEVPFRFGIDEAGNYGYYKGESFVPFGQDGSSGVGTSTIPFDGTIKHDSNLLLSSYTVIGLGERLEVIKRS